MLNKTDLMEQIELLPVKFSVDELIEKLLLVEKIKNGIVQSQQNQVISDEDLDKKMREWFV